MEPHGDPPDVEHMARMIPPTPAPETNASERRAYDSLRSGLPDTWTVIHGQRFLIPPKPGAPAREGELDFLVLDPERAVLGLEVKGGRVHRDASGWASVDRTDQRKEIRDPVQQVQTAVHEINRYLGDRGFRCRFGWGVVLPDTETPGDMGPELPRILILDRTDFLDVRPAIDRIFAYWGESRLPAPAGAAARTEQRTSPRNGAEDLVAALVERFPPASRLALQFKEENQELLRLTEEQMVVLDNLGAHKRAAIEGAAGTGKTVLALEKARRLATTGAQVLLLCFNRPLAAALRRQAEGFATEKLRVETFHEFCRRAAQCANLPFEPKTGRASATRFWEREAPWRLLEALERTPGERYDAIVVDEGQDFLPDWWPCLDEALKDGCDGTLYAFYDPNQDIYAGGPPAALEVIETRLVHNCRNTTRIAEYAAGLIDVEALVKRGAPEGMPVEVLPCDGDDDIVRQVGDRLRQLIVDEGVEPARIAVVSTRTLKNSPFAGDRRVGDFQLVNLDNTGSWTSRTSSRGATVRQVVFDTLDRFKGLERDVVLLLDLPGGDRAVTAHHRYVAASRAKNLLVVVRPAR